MSLRRMMTLGLVNYVRGLINAMRVRIKTLHGFYEGDTCLENSLNEVNKINLLTDASLVITPNGYNEGILHTIKGNPITSEPYNLATYTESSTNWSVAQASFSSTATTNPFSATTTVPILTETTATNTHRANTPVFTVNSGRTYTASVYLKRGDGATAPGIMQLYINNGFDATHYANYNITGGTVTATNNCTGSITNIGSGWYRCAVTVTATSSISTGSLHIVFVNNNPTATRALSYAGLVTSNVLLFGTQIEESLSATTYQSIPFTQLLEEGYLEFVRTTTAYRTNSNGLVQEVPQQNLIPFSTDFFNWSNVNTSYISNNVIAPDGTRTADSSVATAASRRTQISSGSYYSLLPVTNYVFSIYAKAGDTATEIRIGNEASFLATVGRFDLINGTIVSTSNCTATIENVGDGWYRCAIYLTNISLNNVMFIHNGTTNTIGLHVWGALVTTGSTLTDFYQTISRINTIRLDYEESSCPDLLMESSSTNLIVRSEEFDNASWIKSGITVSANTEMSPNSFTSGDTLTASVNNAYITQNGSVVSVNVGRIFSVYLKRKTGTGVVTIENGRNITTANTNTSTWTRVNVQGTVLTSTYSAVSGTYTVTTSENHNLNNGDNVRFAVTSGAGVTTNGVLANVVSPNVFTFVNGTATSVGSANLYANFGRIKLSTSGDEVYAWGAQLESVASTTLNGYYLPSSYIPTITAIGTRASDIAAIYKIRNNNILTNAFSLFFEVKKVGGGTNADYFIGLSDTPFSVGANSIYFSGLPLQASKRDNNVVTQILTTTTYQPDGTTYFKGLLTNNNGVIEIWVDGSKLISNTFVNYTGLTLVNIVGTSVGVGFSRFKEILGWNRVINRDEIDLLFAYPYYNSGYSPVNNELQQIINRANYEGFILPSITTLGYCDSLITSMKSDGIWSVGDLYFNFAYNDTNLTNFARINWKNPYGNLYGIATLNGGLTYQTNGFKGNGSDAYIDTRFSPALATHNYVLNNAGRFFVVSVQNSASFTGGDGIIANSNNRITLNGGNAYVINAGNNGISTDATGTGLKGVMRYASNSILAINTSATTTGSTASTVLANSNQLILRSGAAFGDGAIANYYMGASLTNTQIQNFRTYYNTFLTNVGLTAFA